MSKYSFPYAALAISIVFMLVIIVGGQQDENGATKIPLLTLLIVSEFSFILCSIGAYLSFRRIFDLGYSMKPALVGVSCIMLAVLFLMKGIELWPL